MRIHPSILCMACAGAVLSGCANGPAGRTAAAGTNLPPVLPTNAAVAEPVAEEEDLMDALSSGKGNPEALAHFATGEGLEARAVEAEEKLRTGHFAASEATEAGRLHEQAMEEWFKSVMADPDNEKTAYEVAQWLLEQHHAERAVELLSKVTGRPGVSAPILSLLALADLQAGKTNAAVAAGLKAIARRPDSLRSYESELEILRQTGKTAQALKTLDQASKHIRNTPCDLIILANLYADFEGPQEKQKDPARLRAVALLDRAAALQFSDRDVREMNGDSYLIALWDRQHGSQHGSLHFNPLASLADAYERLDELKKAADIYQRLVAQAVDSATLRSLFRGILGKIYLDANDPTNAAVQFQAIVKDDPVSYPYAWYFLGVLTYSDAMQERSAHQPARAEAKLADAASDFEKALRVAPGLEPAYYHLALVLADAGNGDTALQFLDRARLRFADSFEAQFYNALVNVELQDFDQAVKHFTAAESIARTNDQKLDRQFYFQIGAACERARQYPRAEGYLQKCIDLQPDDAEALNYLGFMWADRGEHLPKARACIEKACKLEPKNAAYLDSMGWVLYKLNQAKDALPWMLRAVELSPDPDPTILDHLGDVYLALRQLDKAMEFWKKSLSIEPNDEILKKLHMVDAGAT